MPEKKEGPEGKKTTQTEREKALPESDDPILKKLRYPDKGEYRVKYEDDDLVITSDEDRK